MEETSLLGAKHDYYLQLWRSRVMDCRNSGKTIAAWCEENGINIKTYYFWQKRVWDTETQTLIPVKQDQPSHPHDVQFAQVNLGMDSSSDADIVIRKGSWTLEVRNSASPAILSMALQAVTRDV